MTTTTPATQTASPGLSQIGQIAVNAHDIERAIAFYRDTLGMKFLFQAGTLGFFDCGGVRLMLSPPESAEYDHPGSILYYKVTDIQASHSSPAASPFRASRTSSTARRNTTSGWPFSRTPKATRWR